MIMCLVYLYLPITKEERIGVLSVLRRATHRTTLIRIFEKIILFFFLVNQIESSLYSRYYA